MDKTLLEDERVNIKHRVTDNAKKMDFLGRKHHYLTKISNPDLKTGKELILVQQQMEILNEQQTELQYQANFFEESLQKLQLTYAEETEKCQRALTQVVVKIDHLRDAIKQAEKIIQDRDISIVHQMQTTYKEQVDYLQRKKYYLQELCKTKGRHPDSCFRLPTSESGLMFYIDEEAVFVAMQKEANQKYSFIANNCSTSAKRCLLAGITPTLRKLLIEEIGFSEQFLN
ncbi:hypothetical protein [Legionella tunisiensis]|uniref:hypothetical protein n=1 Tax=Legionella tunisiensis TaxID=1034944 RepID=UPI0002D47B20|nr:hypothetical protein [Legionella tunisiensis]